MTETAHDLPALAELVGANVKRLRGDRDWSQRDLLMSLRDIDANWSRATVGLLESDGVRGERLSDLAALCAVLQVPLWELLVGGSQVRLRDGNVKKVDWIIKSLRGEHEATTAEDTLRIGRHDPDITNDLARRVGTTANKFESFIEALAKYQGVKVAPPGSAAVLRDLVAGVSSDMAQETVRAKRGHAARRIIRAGEMYEERPGRGTLPACAAVVWPPKTVANQESSNVVD